LRTREFLWQEGHSVFATKEEADKEVFKISRMYKDTYEKLMAIPVLEGLKSEKEKFAGADYSISLETLMPDGKAIQACTSHHLGQNFSKPFNISFLDKNEKRTFGWQNSWGFTTRSLGVMIAVHGDDKGLVLPPRIAPNKVVIVPILFKGKEASVLKAANALKKSLNKYGAILEDREGYSAGRKFNDWEIRGIPLRIEIGPRDVQNKSVVVARRDTSEKVTVKVSKLDSMVLSMLKEMHSDMFGRAKKRLMDSIVDVKSVSELKKVVSSGKIGRTYWCGTVSSENEIKQKTGAKSLNSELRARVNGKNCFVTGGEAKYLTYFGKSY
jgi:prolyl-tRNA synthetase